MDRMRMTEQQLNWLQHQQPQNSVQMPCTSADMFSDGCLTNDWSHHLANDAANPEDAAFFRQFLTSASSWQGSLSTDVNLCSLKADNAAVLQPLASSDPAFVERAAKFSSFNGESLKSSADSSRAESDGGGRLVAVPEETSVVVVSDRHPTNGISRKRKIDRKASWDSDESTEKRGKKNEAPVKVEEASNNEISAESSPKVSKETSKTSTEPPKDYIHVRARRGQATDSHSLAERVRREKISERMRHLQDLVPGCNKVTGKAVMLDEIINYVKSLQRQVEFLSMKLAAVNPRLDFNIDRIFSKEMVGSIASSGNFTPGPLPTDLASFIHIQQYQQMQCNIRPDMVAAADTCSLHATTDSSPDIFADLSIPQGQVQGPWDAGLHHVFTMPIQAKQPSFSCPSISGNLEGHQSKLDM